MEAAIDEKLSIGELWRQVEFTPDVAAAASKDNLGAGLIAVPSRGQIEDALQVGPGAAVAAVLLCLVQSLPDQILGQDSILAVRLVPGPGRLKIEADSAVRAMALELSQLKHVFGVGDVFGRGCAAVGDHAFFGKSFIRLVKLELGFVTGANVRDASRVFEVHRQNVVGTASLEVADGMDGQSVEPRLERQLIRLVSAIAQSCDDHFVDHFLFGHGVGHHLLGGFTKIKLPLDEALQAGEIRIYVGTDVVG